MKVLIAIDNSECSHKALEAVAERSWTDDTEFKIVSVLEPVFVKYPFAGYYSASSAEAEVEFAKFCQKMIAEKVAQLQAVHPHNKVTGEMLEGVVAVMIIDEATKWNADLLVVGSHGRSGVERFFLGSVAERVASHASCSVEIIKQKVTLAKAHKDSEKAAVASGKVM